MHQDYFHLCHLRFEKWSQCTAKFRDRHADFLEKGREYPCTNLWHETNYACSDDELDCLFELHHIRMANNVDIKDHLAHDVKRHPTVLDIPDEATERKTLMY